MILLEINNLQSLNKEITKKFNNNHLFNDIDFI